MEPDVIHYGCYMDKLVKSGFIADVIKVTAEIKCILSNEIYNMIFRRCAKSLIPNFDSANKMIKVLVVKGENCRYIVDYTVYCHLRDQGVKFSLCVECSPQYHQEN